MIFDTDVLIWCQKGSVKAARLIDDSEERFISILTRMEFLQGARSRQEGMLLKHFLSVMGFEVLALSDNIGHRASIYVEEYGLRAMDALIAATAVENGMTLATANQKHFRMIHDLALKILIP